MNLLPLSLQSAKLYLKNVIKKIPPKRDKPK